MHLMSLPQWRNRKTRYVQGVVGVGPWGFKSLLRHSVEEELDTGSSFFASTLHIILCYMHSPSKLGWKNVFCACRFGQIYAETGAT